MIKNCIHVQDFEVWLVTSEWSTINGGTLYFKKGTREQPTTELLLNTVEWKLGVKVRLELKAIEAVVINCFVGNYGT